MQKNLNFEVYTIGILLHNNDVPLHGIQIL